MDIINKFAKMFLISFFTYLIYEKITDYKGRKKNYSIISITCIVMAIIYVILYETISQLLLKIIGYLLYFFIINKNTDKKYNYMAYLFSLIISYATYLISIILSGTILYILLREDKLNSVISLFSIPGIMSLLFIFLFKIKRIKNGINFLKAKNYNKNIGIYVILCICLIVIISVLPKNRNNMVLFSILFGSVGIITMFILGIKNTITKTYKSKMRDRTIEIQKTEIDEKNKILEEVKEENLNFATTIHKYNKKISALEYIIKNRLEQETNTEFANELAIILKETKETAENFAKETEIKTNKIPETKVPGIDTMLKYMQEESRKKNINFDVKLNASINTLLENTISKDKFETLIGDHLKDAIIAVDASKNTYKSILVTMGLVEGIYEFSVYDTGIEFEIETLLKLGEEQITTHKETGGSGIGFMTTFETLKECKASLIIEEYNPETTSYTKCITIKFDGKNKYKIYSYRANKIKEQKYKRKITIEELK